MIYASKDLVYVFERQVEREERKREAYRDQSYIIGFASQMAITAAAGAGQSQDPSTSLMGGRGTSI